MLSRPLAVHPKGPGEALLAQEASPPQMAWTCQGGAWVTLSLRQDRCPRVFLPLSPLVTSLIIIIIAFLSYFLTETSGFSTHSSFWGVEEVGLGSTHRMVAITDLFCWNAR